MYFYRNIKDNLYTVGVCLPNGEWIPESDWEIIEDAARRVHYLNGGNSREFIEDINKRWEN